MKLVLKILLKNGIYIYIYISYSGDLNPDYYLTLHKHLCL